MKKLVVLLLSAIMVFGLVACSQAEKPATAEAEPAAQDASGDAAGDAADDKYTIVMIPHAVGNEFYLAGKIGADEAAEELGIEFIYDGPVNPQVDQQMEFINTYIAKGVDAICIACLDSEALAPVLTEAQNAGIKVITFDVDAAGGRDWYLEPVPAVGYGHDAVDMLMEDAGATNIEWIFMIESLGDVYQKTAGEAAVAYGTETYADSNCLGLKQVGMSQDEAYKVTNDLLKANPNIKGILSIGTVIYPGIIEALRDAGMTDAIVNIGMGTPNAMKSYLEDGLTEKSLLWNVSDMGYAAVYTAYNAVAGNLVAGDTTMECGKLGTININETGSVIMAEHPFVFDVNNVNDFNF